MNSKDRRFHSIDWLRGFLIMLMVFDHVAMYCLDGWYFRESALTGRGVPELPTMYLIRGLCHFGAPCFVLIAGFCLAASEHNRFHRTQSTRGVTLKLITRGLLLVAIDRLVLSQFILKMPMFDIVTTIGICMVCMAALRRIPGVTPLALIAIAWMVAYEPLVLHFAGEKGVGRVGLTAVLLTGGKVTLFDTPNYFNYPVLIWLPYMMLGWCFARYTLAADPWGYRARKLAAEIASLTMILFVAVRLFGSYGNMRLPMSESLVSFLYLSKYPPSLAFGLYAIWISALLLCLLMKQESARADELEPKWSPLDLLATIGRTPLFAYILHFVLLAGLSTLVELKSSSMLRTLLVTGGLTVTLMPLCALYYRARRRVALLRYL